MSRYVNRIRELLREGAENPGEIPPYILKRVFGLEPWKFGRHAVPNALSKAAYRRVPANGSEWRIWEDEWDLLVVVDSCRPEWMRTVAEEYDWIDDVDTVRSVGSHSREWMKNTFTDEYSEAIEETIYVSGNPYSHWAPYDQFRAFEEINELQWDVDSPTPPPHVVTDRAISVAREEPWDRCIVHYMQPHKPIFVNGESREAASLDERWQPSSTFWRQCIDGHVSKAELEAAFLTNLRYVLDEVDLLLQNVEASSAVVTSDHGQAMGEKFLWSHREGVRHPSMRCVPRINCRATDEQTLEPAEYENTGFEGEQVQTRLKELGYL